MATPRYVGITGGIGAGKSFVSKLFQEQGCPVYDSDSAALRLLEEDAELQKQVKELLGEESYSKSGAYDRAYVASQVFANGSLLKDLNALVHPAVYRDFLSWADRAVGKLGLVGLESALLPRLALPFELSAVVYVHAPALLRVRRAMRRDGSSAAKVQARIQSQASEEEYRAFAGYVLVNDGVGDLKSEVLRIIQKEAAR